MPTKALAKLPAYPGVQSAVDYADDVIAGRVDAGHLVHLACERFKRDLDEDTWDFRPELAERAMKFAGSMPNIKGPEANPALRLMPWQQLVFANLFGFVEPGTSTRRFRQGVVFVPRGNGKTTFAAPLALYMTFMTGESGAEGYAAAVTRDQARIMFDAALNMTRRSPEFRRFAKVETGANAIYQLGSASANRQP
jgi:phage terminase large subunit-like protein